MPTYVTVDEASRVLNMTKLTVRQLMQMKELPIGYIKVGEKGRRTYLIRKDWLENEIRKTRKEEE